MSEPALSPRLLAALGIQSSDISPDGNDLSASVDRIDARYRDAIKAGATPLSPPQTANGVRIAKLADPTSGTTITIHSAIPRNG